MAVTLLRRSPSDATRRPVPAVSVEDLGVLVLVLVRTLF
jgi:hypothetical protein